MHSRKLILSIATMGLLGALVLGVFPGCSSEMEGTGANGATDLATLCTETGGTAASIGCCQGASDFPNLCVIGACTCQPSGYMVRACVCSGMKCFDPEVGCTEQQF